jgi:hypothetical protein
MGNRAVITTEEKKIGIYLHWNGGRDSVQPFLDYCKAAGFRGLPDPYGFACLTAVIANFLDTVHSGLSLGVGPFKELDADNGDNGVYIVEGWDIVRREHFTGPEQHSHNYAEMLRLIAAAQPPLQAERRTE